MARLVLVATPIGNLGDLSARAGETLRTAGLWIVEDTRVSGKLQSHLGIRVPMRVLNEHSGPGVIDRLLVEGQQHEFVCLLTDGGTPVISDPGAAFVDCARAAEWEIDALPGPSAVTTALALSGFYGQRFAFLGFPPRKRGPIVELLAPFRESPLTLVLFESPFRISSLLTAAHDALGARRYAICRELTKLHQQIFCETLPTIPTETQVLRKGEFTIVIEGRRRTVLDSE